MIFPQYPVDPPDMVVGITHQTVMVSIAALVAAKFLVGAATQYLTTFKASSLRNHINSTALGF